jgi:hypothetical protein
VWEPSCRISLVGTPEKDFITAARQACRPADESSAQLWYCQPRDEV